MKIPRLPGIPMAQQPLCAFVLLVAAGVAGNVLSIPLFFGVDLIFGSIAVMVILHFYGVRHGAFAAVVTSAYTYVLWHHPYAAITFTCEALFVGALLHRKSDNIVFLDGMFWLFLGMPLVWLFYYFGLHLGSQATTLILLKQSINGILNTLIASLAVTYLPVHKWAGLHKAKRLGSFEQGLFNLLVLFVFLPALLIMVVNSRDHIRHIQGELEQQLDQFSREKSAELSTWLDRRLYAVTELARIAAAEDVASPEKLQTSLDLIKDSYPEFHGIYYADVSGTTIAFSPRVNEKGQSTIGIDFSGRPYFAELRSGLRPVISDVFGGTGGVFAPIVTLGAPVLKKGLFLGSVAGALDLAYLEHKLSLSGGPWPMQVTLTDRRNNIIASTHKDDRPMAPFNRYEGWTREQLRSGTWLFAPPGNLASVEQWKKSLYIRETRLELNGGASWTLIVEAPLAPLREGLFRTYSQSLSIMVLLSLLSILIAAVVSRKLVKPLWQLGSVTTDLPSKLLDQQAIAWPSSSVREIDSLVLNFKSMGSVLSRQFIEIKAAQARIAQQEKMASIGQLAAGVAHEINNPIGFIMSNLTSLRKYLARLSEFIEAQSQAIRRLSTEAVRQDEVAKEVEESRRSLKIDYVMDDMHALVTESLDGAGRVKKIVQDFKSFTHVDQAGFKPADINECLESTINIVWNELKNKAEVKKDYGDLPQTKCNPGQLNQAFMNLLVNAAHAIEMRGEIAIRTREENGSISVSISDTGCGIPADRMSRIFEPFFTTKEVGKGTGLGLSIAYDIVKKHSGSIDVQSAVGKGTTFTVTIPVVAGC